MQPFTFGDTLPKDDSQYKRMIAELLSQQGAKAPGVNVDALSPDMQPGVANAMAALKNFDGAYGRPSAGVDPRSEIVKALMSKPGGAMSMGEQPMTFDGLRGPGGLPERPPQVDAVGMVSGDAMVSAPPEQPVPEEPKGPYAEIYEASDDDLMFLASKAQLNRMNPIAREAVKAEMLRCFANVRKNPNAMPEAPDVIDINGVDHTWDGSKFVPLGGGKPEEPKEVTGADGYKYRVYQDGSYERMLPGVEKAPDQPTSYREYLLTTDSPTPEGYAQWKGKIAALEGGGEGEFGKIPPGYVYVNDPEAPGGRRAVPVPGTEQATDADAVARKLELAGGQRNSAGDVIGTLYSRTLGAANERAVGGLWGAAAAYNPATPNAELYRQTEALNNLASLESLNAMRASSPTGGAVGAVTEKEYPILRAKFGTLDPKSPHFTRDLDTFVLALLQTVHGYEPGTAMFEAMQKNSGPTPPLQSESPQVNPSQVNNGGVWTGVETPSQTAEIPQAFIQRYKAQLDPKSLIAYEALTPDERNVLLRVQWRMMQGSQ